MEPKSIPGLAVLFINCISGEKALKSTLSGEESTTFHVSHKFQDPKSNPEHGDVSKDPGAIAAMRTRFRAARGHSTVS